jgi:hypothetical protein
MKCQYEDLPIADVSQCAASAAEFVGGFHLCVNHTIVFVRSWIPQVADVNFKNEDHTRIEWGEYPDGQLYPLNADWDWQVGCLPGLWFPDRKVSSTESDSRAETSWEHELAGVDFRGNRIRSICRQRQQFPSSPGCK